MDGDANILSVLHETINVFDRNSVDLVVDIYAFHILSVSFNCIDQVTYVIVAIKLDVSIMDLVLLHNGLNHAIIYFC